MNGFVAMLLHYACFNKRSEGVNFKIYSSSSDSNSRILKRGEYRPKIGGLRPALVKQQLILTNETKAGKQEPGDPVLAGTGTRETKGSLVGQ